MLLSQTPIGCIQIPEWLENELTSLSDTDLLERAVREHKEFVISPATYAMIEKRFLGRTLQQIINPSVGLRHETINT